MISIVICFKIKRSYPHTEQLEKKGLSSCLREKWAYLYEYFRMPDAEANRSLFWWLHQLKWELFLILSDLDVAMELSSDALKSVLVPNPFVRIGRVVTLDSLADSLRWAERFLHHLMPKNMRQDIRIPSAKPAETPMITKSVWRTILWSLLILKQWNHFAEHWYCRGPLSELAQFYVNSMLHPDLNDINWSPR